MSTHDDTGGTHNRGTPCVVLREEMDARWLRFDSPVRVLSTDRPEQVLPLLREIDDAVRREDLHAAGFVSYEAAPGCDPALPAKPDGAFPRLWFGLFRDVREGNALPAATAREPALSWQADTPPEEYDRCFNAVRDRIRDGSTYQVNYSFRLRAPAPDADPWATFLALVGDDPPPGAAFVDTGDWAVCSASPEMFFRLDGDRIESRPMKGTAERGLWFEDDLCRALRLAASPKDRAENVMIVDMVRSDLGRIARPGTVRVSSLLEVEKHATVWQMTSTVCAETEVGLDGLFAALFPPASVTGAPKRRTMEIIAALERSPRRVYTGAIGCLSPPRRARFNVAIRTVLFDRRGGRAEYGVGGGIVWDSTAGGERRECDAKTRVLRPRRRVFDLLETLLWSPSRGYVLLREHLRRLGQSADRFSFDLDLLQAQAELERLAAALPPLPHRVRLLAARSGALRSEAAVLGPEAARFADLPLAQEPVDASDVFLYHKTTARAAYEAALRGRPGHADVLLFNARGEVTESTVANVAVEIDGGFFTPPVACGLLPGTCRAWLLATGVLRERAIAVSDLPRARRVCLFNAVRGLHEVRVLREGK
jgi:para-aminobenzoate synthetase/4-amino-4-deoxychorismate lyase